MDILGNVLILSNIVAQTENLSNLTMEYMDYVTRNYFVNDSVLFIYWSNITMDFIVEGSIVEGMRKGQGSRFRCR